MLKQKTLRAKDAQSKGCPFARCRVFPFFLSKLPIRPKMLRARNALETLRAKDAQDKSKAPSSKGKHQSKQEGEHGTPDADVDEGSAGEGDASICHR